MAADEQAEDHKARGNALLQEGRASEAAAEYGSAIALAPGTAALWSNRSMALLRAGDAEGALRDAEEAVRLRPEWGKGYFRKAKALEALQRALDGASACAEGRRALQEAGGPGAKKEQEDLGKLRSELLASVARRVVQGRWRGTVSKPLGGFDQVFELQPDGIMQCSVYGQVLPGKYEVLDVEQEPQGSLRGGLNVDMGEDSRVPYLFRVGAEDGFLHLCCPMRSPPERPRTFDGPGYVCMKPDSARDDSSALGDMPMGRRIIGYLDELRELMMEEMNASSSDPGMAERLRESLEEGGGGTVNAAEVMAPQTLEDKAKKLAAQTKLAAVRLKYGEEVSAAAQSLIDRKAKPSVEYPAEAQELGRRLKLFQMKAPPAEPAPVEPTPAEAPVEAPAAAADSARAAAAEPASPAPATPAPPAGAEAAAAAAGSAPAAAPSRARGARAPAPCCACLGGVGRLAAR